MPEGSIPLSIISMVRALSKDPNRGSTPITLRQDLAMLTSIA